MTRVFQLLMRLYPREVRDEFGAEMLAVLNAASHDSGGMWFVLRECGGLIGGAARERSMRMRHWPKLAGVLIAFGAQWFLYSALLRILRRVHSVTAALDENRQLTLGLMAVAVLLLIIPLTVVLSRDVQHRANKQRLR